MGGAESRLAFTADYGVSPNSTLEADVEAPAARDLIRHAWQSRFNQMCKVPLTSTLVVLQCSGHRCAIQKENSGHRCILRIRFCIEGDPIRLSESFKRAHVATTTQSGYNQPEPTRMSFFGS